MGKILTGSIAIFSNSAVVTILGLLLVPIILSHVGQEKFGLIVLAIFLSVRQGILGIFSFGVQPAVTKFVAEYYARGDLVKIGQILMTAYVFYGAISCFLVIALFASRPFLLTSFFNVPNLYIDDYSSAINLVFLSLIFQFQCLVIIAYLEGLQKFWVSKTIDTFIYVLYFFGVLLTLFSGYGYIEIVKLWACLHFACYIFLLIALARFKVPGVELRSPPADLLFAWSRYCFYLFSNSISGLMYNYSPKLLVSSLFSPATLAIYEIISKIPWALKSFIGLGNRVISPSASELLELKGRAANETLFIIGLKLNVLFFVPLIFSIFLLSENILATWVGKDYSDHSHLMQILLLVPLLSIFMSFGFSILLGTNEKMSLFPIFGWSIFSLSLIYWSIFLHSESLLQLAVGRLFGLAAMVPFAMYIFVRHFNVRIKSFLFQMFWLLAIFLVPLYFKSVLNYSLQPGSIQALIFCGAALYILVFGQIYFLVLDQREKQAFWSIIRLLFRRVIRPSTN